MIRGTLFYYWALCMADIYSRPHHSSLFFFFIVPGSCAFLHGVCIIDAFLAGFGLVALPFFCYYSTTCTPFLRCYARYLHSKIYKNYMFFKNIFKLSFHGRSPFQNEGSRQKQQTNYYVMIV